MLCCLSSHRKHEVSLTHQQTVTTKSNLITESSSTNEPDLTLSYSQSRLNPFSTIDESKVFQVLIHIGINYLNIEIYFLYPECSDSKRSTATSPTNARTEPTTSRDTQILETPRKIYITTDDTWPLPMMLEDINFFEQGYPIWIRNDPYHSLQVKDEKWRYYAPQEPYKILLPPYEPAILVEDTRRQEDFLTDEFNRLFDEAALISLSEVTPTGTYVV